MLPTPNPAGPIVLTAGGGVSPAIGFVPEGEIAGTVGGAPSGTPILADVFDFTLPETGGESRRLVGSAVVSLFGALLVVLASRRRLRSTGSA